jgi:hypothetical protein
VDENLDAASRVVHELESLGIAMRDVTDTLLVEGINSFQRSFDDLVKGIETKMGMLATTK